MLVLSGCGTGSHAEQGASSGAVFGSVFGSALGGIMGGPRGSDVGTLFGMVGGAMIGASVGSAIDKSEQAVRERVYRDRHGDGIYGERTERRSTYRPPQYDNTDAANSPDESGFDPTGSGDDRISFDAPGPAEGEEGTLHIGSMPRTDAYTTVQPQSVSVEDLMAASSVSGIRLNPMIEIRRATFVDADGDGVISRGEACTVAFEIMNNSSETIHDIRPAVAETTGNKHIHVSPGLRVESIAPHRGVRYTASVVADGRLKDGEAVIKVGVAQGDNEVSSQMQEFRVATKK